MVATLSYSGSSAKLFKKDLVCKLLINLGAYRPSYGIETLF